MRTIDYDTICDSVAALCMEANRHLPGDIAAAIDEAAEHEQSALARETMAALIANRAAAKLENLPLCQDTGTAVVFAELGQGVQIRGGLLVDAIQIGVAQGYSEGYLRKSIVSPLARENSGDNTPAVIHLQLVAGEQLKLTVAPKGGGAENMSRLAMLKPAQGIDGIKEFVLDTVRRAAANPCPPIVVGLGIGGNFEQAAYLAKKALLRPLDQPAEGEQEQTLAAELLAAINQLGIGPQGFGGQTTALAVLVESAPCHFASLPVAVNLNCHVARHASITL